MANKTHTLPDARRRMLITYAVISRGMVTTPDILTGLLPFFEPILMKHNGEIFDKTIFLRDVAESLRWSLTLDLLDQIVNRMVKQRWLVREIPESDQIFRVTLPYTEELIDDNSLSTLNEIS